MNAPDPESPAPSDDSLSEEEFLERLHQPGQLEAFAHELEKIAPADFARLPATVQTSVRAALAKCRAEQALARVREKFQALGAAMGASAGTLAADDRLARCNAAMDEVTDALLETPEPHRTTFLQELLPLRAELRALRLD